MIDINDVLAFFAPPKLFLSPLTFLRPLLEDIQRDYHAEILALHLDALIREACLDVWRDVPEMINVGVVDG